MAGGARQTSLDYQDPNTFSYLQLEQEIMLSTNIQCDNQINASTNNVMIQREKR